MKRAFGPDVLLVSLVLGLSVACRTACAIDAKPTDSALAPDVAKEIIKVEVEIDRVEA